MHSIKIATCNLHSHQTESGITAIVQSTYLRQFMMTVPSSSAGGLGSAPNSTLHTTSSSSSSDMWLEVGTFKLGSVYIDSIKAPCHNEIHIIQDAFLHKHDERAKNLWFIWLPETCAVPPNLIGKCGCRGACNFFGSSSSRATRNVIWSDDQERRSCGSRYSSQSKANAEDPGYGQSLLNKGQMLFDVVVPTYTSSLLLSPKCEDSKFMFTRGYMNQCTPSASRDISEQSLASISRSNCTVASSGTQTDAMQPQPVGSSDTVVSTSHSNVFLQLSQEDSAAAAAFSSPVLSYPSPPSVQRTLSHPESRLIDSEKKILASPTLQVTCSNSIASFCPEKGALMDMSKRTSFHSSGHLRFHCHASSVTSSRRPSSDSPTKDTRIPISKPRSSPPNGQSGQEGIGTLNRVFHRATSLGSESVFSVDDYYPAEDNVQVSTPDHRKTILDVSSLEQHTASSNQSLLQTVIEIPPEQRPGIYV